MVVTSCLVIAASAAAGVTAPSEEATPPEQFHISYHRQPGSMWVTWVRPGLSVTEAGTPFCSFECPGAKTPAVATRVAADTRTYADGASGCRSDKAYGGPCVPWSGVIHTALLTQLPANTLVRYSCGTSGGMSSPRNFTSLPASSDAGPVSFALMGDVGTSMRNINGGMEQYNHTYPGSIFVRDQILAAANTRPLRFVHTFGDISYANGNQPVWDGYGRDMDALLSSIPGLFSPGNHDGEFEFGNSYWRAGEGGGDSGVSYALRFPGPGPALTFNSSHTGPFNSTSLYWSVDSGPVHLVATAGVLGFEPGSEQYRWLEADLSAAASPARRAARPWIIMTDHYPLYCSLKTCNTPMTSSDARSETLLEPGAAERGEGALPSAMGLQVARAATTIPCPKAACEDCKSCTPPYSNRSYCPSDPTPDQCAKWTHQHTPCPPCKAKPPPVRYTHTLLPLRQLLLP